MSELPDVITLGPRDEAERLWKGALDAFGESERSLVSLCESLDLGIRAVEILVIHALQPVKQKFPATIALQLEIPDPAVDVYRDAVTVPKAMQFTDILDLLSSEELECVSPKMHRGWEDRRFSCRRSRATAQEVIGATLDEGDRDQLLFLAAYRNRIFRYPPPLKVEPPKIRDAFPVLSRLVQSLLSTGDDFPS